VTARPSIAAIVLAAGRSRRMGATNKLLCEIDGAPMLARVLDAIAAAEPVAIVVVTGHEADAIAAIAATSHAHIRLAHNDRHAEGMGTSIATGVRAAVGDHPHADGFLICPGDLPGLEGRHVSAVIAAFAPAAGRAICVPVAGGRRGHPVLFAAPFAPALMALIGDRGARDLLSLHADRVYEVHVSGDGVVADIDTAEALTAARAARENEPWPR
jgi:molybdenum cofactor cytidylyltransferase